MKILLTGANGQLGRCLQDVLAATEHAWLACSREQLDITNARQVQQQVSHFQPEVIINAAAWTGVDSAETHAESAWKINAEAVALLAQAANSVNARLIQVSTDYVFDGNHQQPWRETDPTRPLGVYGASKLAGEQAAAQANEHIIVRTAWVFSAYGNNFLKTMLRLAGERDELGIVADQTGTPTWAGDLAQTLVQLIGIPHARGIYHFSGGTPCTWFDFASAIFAALKAGDPDARIPLLKPVSTAEFPTPAKRPAWSVLDDQRLQELLPGSRGNWGAALESVISACHQAD
ncbi:dTDP-4-dehydrorhamnose reductase [Halopseudomonas salegens]|uniref:dTDP-4-dehydrorhamnose reductase n=1 Tax=Halopseudomonas salegens TaxID=1434072 RepID=A0A1H2FP49_9GAMM|nr:dTDP-4-dehydrorhamnose reductase [Halopseudomonas salegens]SDU09110.1 dTDP-4-dehydrorhamnose reductase [Halopseudomonas salegens]